MFRLDIKEAAVIAHRHPDTILKAVRLGEIHGTQRVKSGRWLIKDECLDARLDGGPCPHQDVASRLSIA